VQQPGAYFDIVQKMRYICIQLPQAKVEDYKVKRLWGMLQNPQVKVK